MGTGGRVLTDGVHPVGLEDEELGLLLAELVAQPRGHAVSRQRGAPRAPRDQEHQAGAGEGEGGEDTWSVVMDTQERVFTWIWASVLCILCVDETLTITEEFLDWCL